MAAGWPSQSDSAIPRLAGSVLRNIDLGSGPAPAHRHQTSIIQQLPEPRGEIPETRGGSSVDDPPLSIRVGFADASCSQTCCTGSCSHTCVFDLETYVRRGITHEWIGSWTQQSLRAGTIAYRSYAAWHAINPVAGRPFDLCSSACCQVSGGSVSNAGSLAARATAGLLLKRNEAVFRSE
jgi:peptidoglycan hydrolase-like amidase